tara:strand:+ start:7101 stop:7397 length:297 start_codon:yes stop_codon:yes gene_type:complete
VIQILTAVTPFLRDLLSHITSGSKKTVHGVSTALDGRVGLALVGIWLYPFFTMFLPFVQEYTLRGFEALRQLPDWYIDFIMVLSAALVGVVGYKRRRA